MADLKTTISQTENLKNKVKLAKQRINETIVRGGGTTSKSLSEIPNNINKMLRDNYKKVAIIDSTKTIELEGQVVNGKQIRIPCNFGFLPNMVFIVFTDNINTNSSNANIINSFWHKDYNSWSQGKYQLSIPNLDEKGINLIESHGSRGIVIRIKQIIAIE